MSKHLKTSEEPKTVHMLVTEIKSKLDELSIEINRLLNTIQNQQLELVQKNQIITELTAEA